MTSNRTTTALVLVSLALFPGCGDENAATGDEDNIAETQDLFGDDRLADVLRGKLDRIPKDYAEAEQLFGVGRACVRPDSKEIFVVEEESSRDGGTNEETDQVLPRAIITGCNTDKQSANSAINSFGLMIALFSSPDAPEADSGDPMVLTPIEVMALDRRTGLYNFYVLASKGPDTMSRIQLRPNDDVVEYLFEKGKVQTIPREDRACNNCHANMGPLMNEMFEPWTNWVSTHKKAPEGTMSGETWGIVNEAISLDGSHSRSSFANDLEPIMESAIRVWNDGIDGVPGSGFVQANLDGDQPMGLAGMLRSVFCETELNYASALEVVPIELFVDPGAVAGGQLAAPSSYSIDVFPTLMPVRSEMDKRIERGLMKKRYLSLRTSTAIRLVDDRNDVFSPTRCGLYDAVLEGLPTTPAEVDAHIANVLRAKLDEGLVPAGARLDYMRKLLEPGAPNADVTAARTAYITEVSASFAADAALLETPEGRQTLKQRADTRKKHAMEMFAGDKSPLPILELEAEGAGGGGGAGGSGGGGGGGAECAHDECSEGVALDAACSPCAAAVCAQDSFCCESQFDDQCVTIAQGIATCNCP